MAKPPYDVRITTAAFDDIAAIWDWTVDNFGNEAALRYEALLEQAIADLAADPHRAGAKERTDLLPGLWLYHLSFSRGRVAAEQVVKSPRHFVMFRQGEPEVIEILRILHGSRDLLLHLPRE